MDNVVEISDLYRRFRHTDALQGITLSIPRGSVFGLVGENGAGKTTLIKHILGLLRPQRGSVRVFGLDPVRYPAKVLSRIGSLSEDRDLPGWMCVWEFMRYMHTFYPKWDPDYADRLRETFELDPQKKLSALSQGQLAKAGLLAALAHRPEFLVLDEPSSGLDPNVRRSILESVILTIGEEGRTVLFSSHLLDEVERVADHIAMIHHGNVVLDAPLDAIKEAHLQVVIRARNGRRKPPMLPGALSCRGNGPEWTMVCAATIDEIAPAAQLCGCDVVEVSPPSLETIFVCRSGKADSTIEV